MIRVGGLSFRWTMRKSLGLKENSQIMMISDSDAKEIKIIPLPFSEEKLFIRLRIYIEDKAGALAKIAVSSVNWGSRYYTGKLL